MKNTLPAVGERLVVHGLRQNAIVKSVEWDLDRSDWKITLDWGIFGNSRVWMHDENNVWFRWSSSN